MHRAEIGAEQDAPPTNREKRSHNEGNRRGVAQLLNRTGLAIALPDRSVDLLQEIVHDPSRKKNGDGCLEFCKS